MIIENSKINKIKNTYNNFKYFGLLVATIGIGLISMIFLAYICAAVLIVCLSIKFLDATAEQLSFLHFDNLFDFINSFINNSEFQPIFEISFWMVVIGLLITFISIIIYKIKIK